MRHRPSSRRAVIGRTRPGVARTGMRSSSAPTAAARHGAQAGRAAGGHREAEPGAVPPGDAELCRTDGRAADHGAVDRATNRATDRPTGRTTDRTPDRTTDRAADRAINRAAD